MSKYNDLLGKEVFITCTVDEASSLNDQIQFFANENPVASFSQHSDNCIFNNNFHYGGTAKYNGACSDGTHDEHSKNKKYKLHIKMFTESHANTFQCGLRHEGSRSNSIALNTHRKYIAILF